MADPPAVHALVERLYTAFAGPRPTHVAGCPCCVAEGDQARLWRAPLRQLSADDLGRYAFKAMSTWGSADDYRYFLPRILELAFAPGGWSGLDPPQVVRKMLSAGWRDWPAAQQQPVRAWIGHHWQRGIDAGRAGEDLLDDLALLGDDIGARLAWWHARLDRPDPLMALARALTEDWGRLGVLGPSRVVQWMLTPPRRVALEAAFERWLDDPRADVIAEAIDASDWAADVRRRLLQTGRG